IPLAVSADVDRERLADLLVDLGADPDVARAAHLPIGLHEEHASTALLDAPDVPDEVGRKRALDSPPLRGSALDEVPSRLRGSLDVSPLPRDDLALGLDVRGLTFEVALEGLHLVHALQDHALVIVDAGLDGVDFLQDRRVLPLVLDLHQAVLELPPRLVERG